ncbi:MAG: RES family NAD+ phosphorylase [Limisphaerales bacterium]
MNSLLSEDWHEANDAGCESMSQALGRAAHDRGADALLVPSSRVKGSTNLVFFPESLIDEASAEVLGEEDLERWLKKR